jgi:diguanylate cyclase (GGDEF)-like protein
MADDEPAAYDVIRRAMSSAIPGHPVELLVADNSHAHLERVVAVAHGEISAPGCPVEAPDRCVAARRAQTQVFEHSEDLDACPMLRVADHDHCSAVCVPVSIMGTTVGVAHAIGTIEEPISAQAVDALQALANLAGNRLGMLRIMAETQLQASTDGLTGLINRRSLENRARQLRAEDASFALVIADLDHFKRLNDTHGHDTGDRALRIFAESLRSALRADDLACRYGGEEFAILLPGADVDEAVEVAERVKDALADTTTRGDVPTFTASFGVAHSNDARDFEGVVQCADRALFVAKHHGRNQVCVDGRTAPTVLTSVEAAESP